MLAFIFSITLLTAQGNPVTKVVDGKTYLVHKVIAGETFYKIAKKHGCTVADLQSANPTIKILHPGDEVLVPQKGAAAVVVNPQPTNPQPDVPAPATATEYISYKVKKGETLSKIARDHNTTVDELKRLNKLGNTGLKIGQVLKIPVIKTTTDVVKPQVSTPADSDKTDVQVVVVKPEVKKDPEIKVEEKTNPGMPAAPKVTVQETAVEKEESGMAKLAGDDIDQSRTFVVHPFLPKGSIIVVINENTGKMAYCRVIDNVSSADLKGANVAITKAVADKIGLAYTGGTVKIKYAAP